MIQPDTIIIGAGAAGLATAVCLQKEGIASLILEQAPYVSASWRTHYDRLHLHTDKGGSQLPYLPMPKSYPKYPARDQVVAYLAQYADHFGLNIAFNQHVTAVSRTNDQWQISTNDNQYQAQNVVVATGYTRRPFLPTWPGQDSFTGTIQHSSTYKNGKSLAGKRVLVVGFGNSAGEIAIDLCEHGATVGMAVRSPVNVIPRDLLGIPILKIGIWLSILPPRLADFLSAPIVRLAVGDITRTGLRKPPYGPITQIVEKGRIPLLDIGTMKLIRQGKIRIHPGIARFDGDTVEFVDGKTAVYDAVVLGTGYEPKANDFVQARGVLDEKGIPLTTGPASAAPGLYFCGFYVSPTGMLREAGIEARQIAKLIAAQKR